MHLLICNLFYCLSLSTLFLGKSSHFDEKEISCVYWIHEISVVVANTSGPALSDIITCKWITVCDDFDLKMISGAQSLYPRPPTIIHTTVQGN